jgi:putative endonuclease
MYFVYIIKSLKDGRLYKGMTVDLERRILEHNIGKTKSTRAFRPWELVHFEIFDNKSIARERELFFRSGTGREFLKKILVQ